MKPGSLDQITDEQRVAAQDVADPVLILAGPGSGKTRTLVSRLAYLMAPPSDGGLGTEPDSIMMVTFTNRAAREMRERIASVFAGESCEDGNGSCTGPSASGLWAGTFHSLSLRILRAEGRSAGLGPGFSILDDSDARAVADEVAEGLAKAGTIRAFDKDVFFRKVDLAKGHLISPEFLRGFLESEERFESGLDVLLEPEFVEVFEGYQEELRRQNTVDLA
ncbi:UvrD-helicase domain-containing protein [Amorphus sp. 3PC139-8]|uniref:UvrD-helicase domain-containing protein n=1 Tax=Amorphus sp. 3PC139-8 TaxID=2735676 RepID=UPI00345D34E7